MIKAIIFDCFGVLTEDGWKVFCDQYMNEANSEELRYVNHQADISAVSYEEFLETVCKITGADKAAAHSLITTTHHPNTPLFELAKGLKRRNYKLGIISNVGDTLDNFLPKELLTLFDAVTLSYQLHTTKPQPRIYRAHLQALGVLAEEAVFFDDRESNCEGARAIGMQSFLYVDTEQFKLDLQSLSIKL